MKLLHHRQMGDDSSAPTIEEFLGWPSPADILALGAPWPTSITTGAMISALSSGVCRGFAEKASSKIGAQTTRYSMLPIGMDMWTQEAFQAEKPFWETGHAWIGRNTNTNPHIINLASFQEWRVFNVRFDPADLPAVLPNMRGKATLGTSGDRTDESMPGSKPPSEAAYEKWKAVFLGTHGDGYTEASALHSARAMFPDNRVTRAKVRELIPPQKPGKPASRQKNGE